MIVYDKIWPYIKTGDKVEWRTESMLGALIRMRTRTNRNHCSICINYDEEDEPRRHIIEANEFIQLNLLSDRLREHKGTAYWAPLKSRYDDRRGIIKNWALEQRGIPYDWGGFFACVLGRIFYDVRRFICSEFLCAALVNAEIIEQPKVSPWPGEFDQFGCFGREIRIK